ncbi:DUF445 domain-containing protein [Hydrogenophaga sp.]|uniref:DUF445 domain-containing protein n=1 Tax=Hydrogenophaga sp. TaxID=1904254 RepID=UPI002723AAC8|nr:DUF445 domain-containing protein [Hydrogenophaga sp.]MDO8906618.1 DUF445 domain-containing protein [Hydrogenophaga sp.]
MTSPSPVSLLGEPYSLARMKLLAVGLLMLAALVYVVATLLEPRHATWGYVAAAAEAAMIGALADWFAVVALFRHPLRLPIPHTAIIPANKDRLGRRLAEFLDQNFLTRERVDEALSRWDMAGDLSRWLGDPERARRLARGICDATPDVLATLDRQPVRTWLSGLAQRLLREVDLATLGGQAIEALTGQRHHQRWLDGLLDELAAWAARDSVQERLTEVLARELAQLRYVGLDQVAARLATRKLVAALTRTLAEVAADPEHEWRHRFDAWIERTATRMQDDPQWQAQVAAWRDAWLDQPRWHAPVEAWWHDFVVRLRQDAQAADSKLLEHVLTLLQAMGHQLEVDDSLRQGLNRQVRTVLLSTLDRSRPTIVDFVSERVQSWDATELSTVLESHIGRDLQFIRINGTVVGALVGLTLHAFTEAWLR